MLEKDIPIISLKDFDARKDEIRDALISAAETFGFFVIVDHGLTRQDVEAQFLLNKRFFDLDLESKIKASPFENTKNTGYEFCKQVRPSTGKADEKETLQLQLVRKDINWPTDEYVPGFKNDTGIFMAKCHEISMRILGCFAVALGFEEDFFSKAHDVTKEDAQCTFRLLHYLPSPKLAHGAPRCGAHTDYDCLTLLFQRDGEDGLEVCPGREAHTSFASGDEWTKVPATTGPIVCNIGDMLMAWSDDRFKSNFHRVQVYNPDQPQKSRYTMAYFTQHVANRDFPIKSPAGKYPETTGGQYIAQAMQRYYGAPKVESNAPIAISA